MTGLENLTQSGEVSRVDEEPKTVPDSTFAQHVLAERDALQAHDALTAAERAAIRELLGFLDVLRALVADERFQKEASARIGRWRDTGKAWLLAIGAAAGLVASVVAAVKSFGG